MYQSGGTNTVAFYLCLGNNSGDNGAYNLSGGSLAVSSGVLNGAEYIGYNGNGVFTQTGGTHTVPVPLYLGYNATGSGTYNLAAGQPFRSQRIRRLLRQRQLHAVGRRHRWDRVARLLVRRGIRQRQQRDL